MKVTRKLLVSMLAVVFALITLGATTYAWFTLTSVNTISSVDMTITTGESLYISLDGTTFTSKLTDTMIQEKVGTVVLKPITSADGVTFKMLEGIGEEGTSEEGTIKYFSDSNAVNGAFINIPIWFRATNIPTSITDPSVFLTDLDSTATKTNKTANKTWLVSNGVKFKPAVSYTDVNNTAITVTPGTTVDELTKYAANAMRVAFIPDEASSGVIFNLNDGDGEYKGLDGQSSYYSALNQKNKIDSTIIALVSAQDAETSLTDSFDEQKVAADNTSKILELAETSSGSGVYEGKVFLKVWLEGWDADCYDAVALDTIFCQLCFTLAQKAA